MKTLVLLDLEETLIYSFEKAHPLNGRISEIESLFRTHDIKTPEVEFGWMSWAIWEWSDIEKEVVCHICEFLQKERRWTLNFSQEMNWSMNSWCDLLMSKHGLFIKRQELPGLMGKAEVLLRLSAWLFERWERVVLVDDTVPHCMQTRQDGKVIETINPKTRSLK